VIIKDVIENLRIKKSGFEEMYLSQIHKNRYLLTHIFMLNNIKRSNVIYKTEPLLHWIADRKKRYLPKYFTVLNTFYLNIKQKHVKNMSFGYCCHFYADSIMIRWIIKTKVKTKQKENPMKLSFNEFGYYF
jgi:hypothetical protein